MATSFMFVLAVRIGVGVGEAGCVPASHSMLGDCCPRELRRRVYGAHFSGAFLADDRRSEAGLARVIDPHEAVVDRICSGDLMGAVPAMTCHFHISIMHVARSEAGNAPPAAAVS